VLRHLRPLRHGRRRAELHPRRQPTEALQQSILDRDPEELELDRCEVDLAAITVHDTAARSISRPYGATHGSPSGLNDCGHEFHGRDGVASWNRTDNIGVQAFFELLSVTLGAQLDSYTAVLTVSGNGYNGTGPMAFQLHDGLIAALRIS
jgi:hypothetical protein